MDLQIGMSNFIIDVFSARFVSTSYFDLFFESGSSITWLSDCFQARCSEPYWEKWKSKLTIRTNNIVVNSFLSLKSSVRVSLFPYGPPPEGTRYGATFGDIRKLFPKHDFRSPLEKDELSTIKKMVKEFKSQSNQTLILASASGINFNETDYPLGYHVGSYYNKIFKRVLVETGFPIILFMDESKFNVKFNPQKCFNIFDKNLRWEDAIKNQPLGFCVGAKTKLGLMDIQSRLQEAGFTYFDISEDEDKYNGYMLFVRNKKFQEIFYPKEMI